MERNNKDKILLSITSMSLKSMTSRPKKKRKTIQGINKTKSQFFEKINNIDKLLANLTKQRREKTKLIKSEIKKGYSHKY
jgi:hypothetical protein